ncbi:hypothetical protein [Krasilnikovia sp. MM14-A1004]|uniref:hypothetical protein n=1 Tax=Krasilnikovia sp. MM14-A1004 TaxID=3373541 RepID=UPI00399C70BA
MALVNTAQSGTWSALLYLVVYVACLPLVCRRVGGPIPLLRKTPPAYWIPWLLVAVPSLIELAWHGVYDVLSRQPDLIVDGQVWRLLTSVVVGALVFNLPATFVWHAAGGGNSAATFFLATSMVAAVVLRERTVHAYASGAVALACGCALLRWDDAHGVAVLAGLAAGLVLATAPRPSRWQSSPRSPRRVRTSSTRPAAQSSPAHRGQAGSRERS